jgi:N-acetylglucosaminyldiphosphoundecaprenol N-acetyl-beta-D-mannosaminyltransferase
MAAHRAVVTAPVLIGVGAAFDFLSGGVRQAPRWMQNNGLEWLFRLAMEPRRLARRYLRNNPGFAVAIVRRRPRLVGDPVEDTRG